MKLTYRGIPYQSTASTLETTETEVVGKYRGVEYKVRTRKDILIPHTSLRLKYRGIPHLGFGRFWHIFRFKKVPHSTKDKE